MHIGEVVTARKEMLQQEDTLEDRTVLSPDKIAEMLEICLRTTYFSLQNNFYEQADGAAMGSLYLQ